MLLPTVVSCVIVVEYDHSDAVHRHIDPAELLTAARRLARPLGVRGVVAIVREPSVDEIEWEWRAIWSLN